MSDPARAGEGPGQRLGFRLTAETAAGRARRAALAGEPAAPRVPTSLVEYRSRGQVLVLGAERPALALARRLPAGSAATVLASPAAPRGPDAGRGDRFPGLAAAAGMAAESRAGSSTEPSIARAPLVSLEGHLGAFRARVRTRAGEVDLAASLGLGRPDFDVVVDLGQPPRLGAELPPYGYFAPADEAALEQALAEIPDLVGEFEKPRYFSYDPDICAHGASGLTGCTRCLEVCPTDAIGSIGERIEVDPYLCQGAGSCATACPTGAITYAYPAPADLLRALAGLLGAWREAGVPGAPCVVLHGAEVERAWLAGVFAHAPEWCVPFEVEEPGSVGLDAWLAALAFGAGRVALLCPPATPASVRAELGVQLSVARAILEGLGHGAGRVELVNDADAAAAGAALAGPPPDVVTAPATFAPQDEKRTNLRLALDHLVGERARAPVEIPLPAGAPFGRVALDLDACTLCMACASVCPAGALEPGGDTPALRFIEWNCVQCGLCETACPEDAIRPEPRLLCDREAALATRTLKAEEPFPCARCGKPFATRSLMRRMEEKLAGHWMFQNPATLERLRMCEDCRIRDMLEREGGMIDPHGDGRRGDGHRH